MTTIEFFKDSPETTLPIVRLTKSRNKTTGTATFIFLRPKLFDLMKKKKTLKQMSLIHDSTCIMTTDIKIFFYQGKPFLIKSLFIFKNSQEWFKFLTFMQVYSKKAGLSFTEFKASNY